MVRAVISSTRGLGFDPGPFQTFLSPLVQGGRKNRELADLNLPGHSDRNIINLIYSASGDSSLELRRQRQKSFT